jgi:hypothetical protein
MIRPSKLKEDLIKPHDCFKFGLSDLNRMTDAQSGSVAVSHALNSEYLLRSIKHVSVYDMVSDKILGQFWSIRLPIFFFVLVEHNEFVAVNVD